MDIWTSVGGSLVALGLNLLFGLLYASCIHELNKRGWLEGYTAIAVVFGTLVTLMINQVFVYVPNDRTLDFLLELAGFAASGLFMTLNNIYEHLIKNDQMLRLELEEAHHE